MPADTAKVTPIDPTRHLLQFDPHVFDNTRVDVVGCGAVGAPLRTPQLGHLVASNSTSTAV